MITIEVTQGDINGGKRSKCKECPVALAISRHINLASVVVRGGYCLISGTEYDLPMVAELFIDNFDYGLQVRPFTFELDYTPAVA